MKHPLATITVSAADLHKPLADFCVYEWQRARLQIVAEAQAHPAFMVSPCMWLTLAAMAYPEGSMGRWACKAEQAHRCHTWG